MQPKTESSLSFQFPVKGFGYLPGKDGNQHFSSHPKVPVSEAKFQESKAEKWRIPSFTQLPVVGQSLSLRNSALRTLEPLCSSPWQSYHAKRGKPKRPEATDHFPSMPSNPLLKQGYYLEKKSSTLPASSSRTMGSEILTRKIQSIGTEISEDYLKELTSFDTEYGEVQA